MPIKDSNLLFNELAAWNDVLESDCAGVYSDEKDEGFTPSIEG